MTEEKSHGSACHAQREGLIKNIWPKVLNRTPEAFEVLWEKGGCVMFWPSWSSWQSRLSITHIVNVCVVLSEMDTSTGTYLSELLTGLSDRRDRQWSAVIAIHWYQLSTKDQGHCVRVAHIDKLTSVVKLSITIYGRVGDDMRPSESGHEWLNVI